MDNSLLIHQRSVRAAAVRCSRTKYLLCSPKLSLIAALTGILLTFGSRNAGWIDDDVYQRWVLTGSRVLSEVRPASRLDMFRFLDGDPNQNVRLKELGLLPWWISDHVCFAFWKPFTSLTHLLDYVLWPSRPDLMHLQNLFWFALLLLATARLYRQFMGPTVSAGLAIVLYAITDVHALPVAWLANRNSVMAALFGVLLLQAHQEWRRRGSRTAAVAGPTLLAMSLLSAEAGTGILGYLLVYELTLNRRASRRSQLTALAAYGLVVIAWRIVWVWLGYGVTDIGDHYIDPVGQPMRYTSAAFYRLPLLLLTELGYQPADKWQLVIGIVVVCIFTWCAWPTLRRSRIARFWAMGALLALIPISATVPAKRQLMFVCIGGCGLLGQFFSTQFSHQWPYDRHFIRKWAARMLALLLGIRHILVAPYSLATESAALGAPNAFYQRLHALPNVDESKAEAQNLIFVNHPLPFDLFFNLYPRRAVDGYWLPQHALILAPSSANITLERLDANTLRVTTDTTFFPNYADQILSDRQHLPRPMIPIKLPLATVTVLKTDAVAQPKDVLFQFSVPLEDASLQWVCWKGGFQRFVPPEVGASVKIIPNE